MDMWSGIAAGKRQCPLRCCPSQNASGNWIKIVQRLPGTAFSWIPMNSKRNPLRVGLSTTVSVDVHDTSGPLITTTVRNVPQPIQPSGAGQRTRPVDARNRGDHR